jgi:hypothetical protein
MTELYVFRGTIGHAEMVQAARNYRPIRSENGFFPEL